jgi:hypothetical protein
MLTILPAVIETVARAEADKRRLAPLFRRVMLPDDYAGHSPEWVAARLMQHLLTRHPELIENVLSVEEALFTAGENADRFAIPSGETVARMRAWDIAPLLAALAQECALFPPAPLPVGFAPGSFAQATWQLVTSAQPRDAAQQASAWLTDLRLSHTLRRDGDDWRIDMSPAAAKKKSVFALCVAALPNGSVLTVSFSPKAALCDLLSRLPPQPGKPKAVCLQLS